MVPSLVQVLYVITWRAECEEQLTISKGQLQQGKV